MHHNYNYNSPFVEFSSLYAINTTGILIKRNCMARSFTTVVMTIKKIINISNTNIVPAAISHSKLFNCRLRLIFGAKVPFNNISFLSRYGFGKGQIRYPDFLRIFSSTINSQLFAFT